MAEGEKDQNRSASIESLTTGIKYEDPRFPLHLVQKRDPPSERPMIHSTKLERLAYFRGYATSATKTKIMATQQVRINSFLWFYILNIIFKTLPHSFVHFFYAAYTPEEHNFVTKMVPICLGCKFLFVMVGSLELLCNFDMIVLLVHYMFVGLLHNNPWNRCEKRMYFDKYLNETMLCFEMERFARFFGNASFRYADFTYITMSDQRFQVSQIDYYRRLILSAENERNFIQFIVLWGGITLLHLCVSFKYFWKIFHFSQLTIIMMDLFNLLYLNLQYYSSHIPSPIYRIAKNEGEETEEFWIPDVELLAESITAPAIIHVLTSRSIQAIDPTEDSAAMVASNAIMYIFRGLLSNYIQSYCESTVNTEIPVTQFNQYSWFYLIPMYWNTFYLGDILSIAYMTLSFITEYLIMVVTFKCIAESVSYEWPKLKRWMFMGVFILAGFLMYFLTTVDQRIVLWIYGKGIATLAETVFIYLIYPVGRVVDDYTFHYGIEPTRLRILSLRLVPIYYVLKLYIMITLLWEVLDSSEVGDEIGHYIMWSWLIMLIPIALGMAFIAYKYLVTFRMTWWFVLRAVPKWGPRDFCTRQLRKQFDSRYYISSEAPKLLTRYLMAKRDSKIYKVDVRYDYYRRSTVSPMAVRFGTDKSKHE